MPRHAVLESSHRSPPTKQSETEITMNLTAQLRLESRGITSDGRHNPVRAPSVFWPVSARPSRLDEYRELATSSIQRRIRGVHSRILSLGDGRWSALAPQPLEARPIVALIVATASSSPGSRYSREKPLLARTFVFGLG